ncbi:MAG: hypothetical protein Q7R51_01545 [bacterium]|nr:hypothetical protein [bacterium]
MVEKINRRVQDAHTNLTDKQLRIRVQDGLTALERKRRSGSLTEDDYARRQLLRNVFKTLT